MWSIPTTGTRRLDSAETPRRSSSGSARGTPCPSSSGAPGSTSARSSAASTRLPPSLQSIGYREFVEVERGRLTEDEALRRMQRDTVRYAKRQWTWFTREPDIEWIDVEAAGSPARVAERIARQLAPAWKEGVTA